MPGLMHLAILLAALLPQAEPTPPQQPPIERLRPVRRIPRDDGFFNTGPLIWKGVELHAGWMGAGRLEMDVPDAIASQSQGFLNPFVVRFEYEELDVQALEAGATFDFGLFRFSFDGFLGDFDGTGTLVVDDGVNPLTRTPVSIEGDFYGAKGGVYWPAFRLRSGPFEAALGPDLTVAWYGETVDSVPGSPLPLGDRVSQIVGGLGPRLSIRYLAPGFDVTVEAEMPFLFGAAQGWGMEFSAGVGLRF